MRRYGFITLMIWAAILVQNDRSREPEFVHNVRSMFGNSYSEENCSQFVCLAHGTIDRCTALDIWNGCGGKLDVIQEINPHHTQSLANLDLPVGSVIAFHGAHVAVYLGGHVFADSTPERGVSKFKWENVGKNDSWYTGPVRILMWK